MFINCLLKMSVVDINDFDIRCLTFNKINPDYQAKLDKEGKGIRNQYSIYPKYEGKQLSLCLTINSLEGGQTSNKDKTGKEFCDIEASNIKFNIGLNPKYEECVKLKEVIRLIEDKLKKNIGDLLEAELQRNNKTFKNYTFSSCIKVPKVPSEEDPDIMVEVEDTEEKYSSLRLKYDQDYSTGKISTVFETDEEEAPGIYKKYNVSCKKDIAEIPIWRSKVRLMFKLVRVWVSRQPLTMFQNQKAYGLIFKLTRVHIFNNKSNTIQEKEEESINWLKGIKSKEEMTIDNSEHKEEEKEENLIEENIIEVTQSQEKENETEIKNDDDEIFEEVLSIEPRKDKKKKHKKSN